MVIALHLKMKQVIIKLLYALSCNEWVTGRFSDLFA